MTNEERRWLMCWNLIVSSIFTVLIIFCIQIDKRMRWLEGRTDTHREMILELQMKNWGADRVKGDGVQRQR